MLCRFRIKVREQSFIVHTTAMHTASHVVLSSGSVHCQPVYSIVIM